MEKRIPVLQKGGELRLDDRHVSLEVCVEREPTGHRHREEHVRVHAGGGGRRGGRGVGGAGRLGGVSGAHACEREVPEAEDVQERDALLLHAVERQRLDVRPERLVCHRELPCDARVGRERRRPQQLEQRRLRERAGALLRQRKRRVRELPLESDQALSQVARGELELLE